MPGRQLEVSPIATKSTNKMSLGSHHNGPLRSVARRVDVCIRDNVNPLQILISLLSLQLVALLDLIVVAASHVFYQLALLTLYVNCTCLVMLVLRA